MHVVRFRDMYVATPSYYNNTLNLKFCKHTSESLNKVQHKRTCCFTHKRDLTSHQNTTALGNCYEAYKKVTLNLLYLRLLRS